MTEFVLFDMEYASWKGFLTDTEENKKKVEIVQIAALKIDKLNLKVVDTFNVYVKPYFTPKLTQYFIDLTQITDDLLDKKGIRFLDAYEKFASFVGDSVCLSHGWGLPKEAEVDGSVLKNNLALWGKSEQKMPRFFNIAPWFKEQYEINGIEVEKQSSGDIAEILSEKEKLKDLELDKHNAMYDVYSLLIGMQRFNFNLDDYLKI